MTKQTQAKAANTIRDAAYRYIDAGYRVLPADARRKFPTLASYKQYRNKPPTEKQNETWFSSANAVCILTGEVYRIATRRDGRPLGGQRMRVRPSARMILSRHRLGTLRRFESRSGPPEQQH
jgi:hypothetical protein